MEMVIFIGAQASGKSTFYRERFQDTHLRVNLDMLRTRRRESLLVSACLKASQSFVVDNTNPMRSDRSRYFALARDFSVTVAGFYFQSSIQSCIARNEGRAGAAKAPAHAIAATVKKLELPALDEGFDQLNFVRFADTQFVVEDWKS